VRLSSAKNAAVILTISWAVFSQEGRGQQSHGGAFRSRSFTVDLSTAAR